MSAPAISAHNLARSFGSTKALVDVSLDVAVGSVCALLGRNGAGKTTTVRILTTLLPADGGRAQVAGFDVDSQAALVRTRIGVTGQTATMDELLTGAENLETIGRFCHLGAARSRRRARELLEQFDLVAAGKQLVKRYSGGMRRRLDLAASLIHEPEVLFLDEPTTGLDPLSRRQTWAMIEDLHSQGRTVLLTTHYIEEAEQLAELVYIIDGGKVVAEGSPTTLIAELGAAATISVAADPEAKLEALPGVLRAEYTNGRWELQGREVGVILAALNQSLGEGALRDVSVRPPSLEDVFLARTGRHIQAGGEP